MKHVSLLILLISSFLSHAAPSASLEGTVSGTIQVAENRDLGFITAVTGTSFPQFRSVRRVVVAVTAIPGDGSNFINPTFFAVTDNLGRFTVRWLDQTRSAFPVRLRVTVLWRSSSGTGGGPQQPATLFRIERLGPTGTGVISPQSVFKPTVTSENDSVGVLRASASDETAAYLTTREFFEQIVDHSRILRERMPGLVVRTRVPDFDAFFGITPLPHAAFVSEGSPASIPFILAHELGHAVTWAALDLNSAPINLASDYNHPGGVPFMWGRDQREFSKAAFLEGLADAWALEWAFGSDASAAIQRGNRTFRYEVPQVLRADGTVALDCRTVANAHEFPFCHTAALRDLLDAHGADGVDLRRADIVDTLDRFPNCLGNGCRDEPGLDALNHHDFLCNATPASRRTAIRTIWSANAINGGPASSCSQ